MQRKDRGYLWDMASACDEIIDFTEGLTYEEFEVSKLVRYAVERQPLVVGEAAAHVSQETRLEYDSIPWQSIVGLRNILAHDYGDVLTQRVWSVANRRILELKDQLEKILSTTSKE